MARLTDKRTAFLAHRSRAEWRGIPFRLTFGEWSALWAPHWASRSGNSAIWRRNTVYSGPNKCLPIYPAVHQKHISASNW